MSNIESNSTQVNADQERPGLRKPLQQGLAATSVLLFSYYLIIQDLITSNRPHELDNAPWVAGITLLNLIPCTLMFKGLVRYSATCKGVRKRGIPFYLLVLGLVIVEGLNVLLLATAASAVPAVLRN